MNAAGISFLRSAAKALIAENPGSAATEQISGFVERVMFLHDGAARDLEAEAGPAASTKAQSLDWKVFRPGVEIIHLCSTDDDGPAAALLRYASGGTVPHHLHVGDEHILVLDGSQSDERGHYPRGALVHNLAGSSHSVLSSAGCLIAIVWEKPIVFSPVVQA